MPFRLFRMSEHVAQPREWLWRDRIPMRSVTILDGDPSVGKGLLTADIVARVTRGRSMFGTDEASRPSHVILIQSEDTRDDVDGRLRAANADRTRVNVIDRQAGSLVLPGDLPALEAAIRETQARLVVIDPAISVFTENVSNYQAVHRTLDLLTTMVEYIRTALIFVRHFTKAGGKNPLYRGFGSIALTGIARSELLLAANPSDPQQRVLAQSKTNLGRTVESLCFRIVDRGGSASIEWSGVSRYTAHELLEAMSGTSRCELEEATYFIYCMLAGGARMAREVFSLAAAERIAVKTLKRAKKVLGVNTRREGGYGADGYYIWWLPEDDGAFAHLRERMQAELAAGGRHYEEGVVPDDDGVAPDHGGAVAIGGAAPTVNTLPREGIVPIPNTHRLLPGPRALIRRPMRPSTPPAGEDSVGA